MYAGATLRRWGRTIARSRDRATLGRALRRGVAAGLGTAPRPTAAVLDDLGLSASGRSDAPENVLSRHEG